MKIEINSEDVKSKKHTNINHIHSWQFKWWSLCCATNHKQLSSSHWANTVFRTPFISLRSVTVTVGLVFLKPTLLNRNEDLNQAFRVQSMYKCKASTVYWYSTCELQTFVTFCMCVQRAWQKIPTSIRPNNDLNGRLPLQTQTLSVGECSERT
jgi:hypothetical protein